MPEEGVGAGFLTGRRFHESLDVILSSGYIRGRVPVRVLSGCDEAGLEMVEIGRPHGEVPEGMIGRPLAVAVGINTVLVRCVSEICLECMILSGVFVNSVSGFPEKRRDTP